MVHGLSCYAACGIFPDQGWKPCPLHGQADSSFSFLKKLFIYLAVLGLRCCTRAFSSCGERGIYSLLRCAGFSLPWLLLLQSTGSGRAGIGSCGTRA